MLEVVYDVYEIIFKNYVYRFKWMYILVGICFLLLFNFICICLFFFFYIVYLIYFFYVNGDIVRNIVKFFFVIESFRVIY